MQLESNYDFVKLFPPELSNVIFFYVNVQDLFSCGQCSFAWREVINSDQQWNRRCLQRGWSAFFTQQETTCWGNFHNDDCMAFQHFRKWESFRNSRLSPMCRWSIYFRQRMLLEKNWNKGNYSVRQLIPRDSESENVVTTVSDFNGRYFLTGTTSGLVHVWDVAGPHQLKQTIQPIDKARSVEKIIGKSEHLVILYDEGIVHVYEASEDDPPFLQLYEASFSLCYGDDGEAKEHVSLEMETFRGKQLDSWLKISTNLRNDFLTSAGHCVVSKDALLMADNESALLTTENLRSFIVWNLKNEQESQCKLLPHSYRIIQVAQGGAYFMLIVNRTDNIGQCGILFYKKSVDGRTHTSLMVEMSICVKSSIDEISYECGGDDERIAYCDQDGVIGACRILSGETLFHWSTEDPIDNLGKALYKTLAHIGPVRKILCVNQYLISGSAVRELTVWEKFTGKKLHRVYRQPSHIINVFANSLFILTEGRSDPPAMILYT